MSTQNISNDEKEFYLIMHGWRPSTNFEIAGTIYKWVREDFSHAFPVSLQYAYECERKLQNYDGE